MSYGSKECYRWVLEEDEGASAITFDNVLITEIKPISLALKHIKLAYDLGINAFDTADIYSHGVSLA